MALAASQHGVITLAQLAALGVTARSAQRRVTAGRLHRLRRGVYAIAPLPLLGREARWLAAVFASGPGAVLSHRSAAALHELRTHGATRVEVTVPNPSARLHAGIRAHRCALHPDDITIVRGIPCTTVARTLVDLAATLGRRPVERACDQAEILETFDLTAIIDQFDRHPHRPGTRRLKAVLETHYVGRQTHATRQSFENDRRRDQRLTAAHWRPLRATWLQITRMPAQLERTLNRAFAAGPPYPRPAPGA